MSAATSGGFTGVQERETTAKSCRSRPHRSQPKKKKAFHKCERREKKKIKEGEENSDLNLEEGKEKRERQPGESVHVKEEIKNNNNNNNK